MLITCPACRRPFTIAQLGAWSCPSCGGQVGVSQPPRPSASSDASKQKGRLGIILAVALGAVVLISMVGSPKRGETVSSRSATAAVATPAPRAEAEPPAVASRCDAALPKLRAACPRAASWLAQECMTSKHPVNALVNIDDLRPGVVINFGAPGPEWFLRDDGTLITMNGIAGSACDGLMDVPAAIGRQMTASAPKRGHSAKTYEGTYDRNGNFLHPDCSEFEIRIGRIYYQALWKDPEASDEQAGRHAAKAAKKAGVKREVAEAIYGKTASVCIQAITSP